MYGGSNELLILEKVEFILITIINIGIYKGIVVLIKVVMLSESNYLDKYIYWWNCFIFFFKDEYFIYVCV